MKKLFPILFIMLLLASAAWAESSGAAAPTPSPTPIPDLIAQPSGTPRPIMTATPRPEDAPLPEDYFLAQAVELARRIGLMAESSVYFYHWNISGATEDTWEAVTRGDHAVPSRILHLSGDVLLAALAGPEGRGADWIDLTRPEIRRDMVDDLVDAMLAGAEDETISLVHALARTKVFACEEAQGCGLFLMFYADGVPMAVSWYAEDGAVRMGAFPMPAEGLEACGSAADVAAWFEAHGLPAVTFEEVRW